MDSSTKNLEQIISSRKKQLKQGFSIDELVVGAASSDDSDDGSFGGELDDENGYSSDSESNMKVVGKEEDFVDRGADERNERWVQKHFEQGVNSEERISVCCPSCFTPLSYQAYSTQNGWRAKKVVHCLVSLNKETSESEVCCAECGVRIGRKDNTHGTFHFEHVLPSSLSEHL